MTDVEGSAVRPRGPVLPSEDEARVEHRCAACGYGATVRMAPATCPMCRGSVWEHAYALYPDGHDVSGQGLSSSGEERHEHSDHESRQGPDR
jgi:hypothetical protein